MAAPVQFESAENELLPVHWRDLQALFGSILDSPEGMGKFLKVTKRNEQRCTANCVLVVIPTCTVKKVVLQQHHLLVSSTCAKMALHVVSRLTP